MVSTIPVTNFEFGIAAMYFVIPRTHSRLQVIVKRPKRKEERCSRAMKFSKEKGICPPRSWCPRTAHSSCLNREHT